MQRSGRGSLWPDKDLFLAESDSFEPPEAKKSRQSGTEEDKPLVIPTDSPLHRLRWVTLGYHYDWGKKEYSSENKSPFPDDLGALSSFILHCIGFPGSVV